MNGYTKMWEREGDTHPKRPCPRSRYGVKVQRVVSWVLIRKKSSFSTAGGYLKVGHTPLDSGDGSDDGDPSGRITNQQQEKLQVKTLVRKWKFFRTFKRLLRIRSKKQSV